MGTSSFPPDPHSPSPAAANPPTTAAVSSSRTFTSPPPPPQQQQAREARPLNPTPFFTGQTQPSFSVSSRVPNSNSVKPQDPPQGVLYPVGGPGRGLLPKSIRPKFPDPAVTVANPGTGFPPRPVMGFPPQMRPFGFTPYSDSHFQAFQMMRAPQLHHSHVGSTGGSAVSGSAPIKGVPVSGPPKVVSSPSSASDCNGYKDPRDQDTIKIVRDRKVRILEGASIYSLCRSWLRNGYPEERQPQFENGVKSLPRPLPISVADAQLPKKRDHSEEEEDEGVVEDKESVENLSAQDLLQRHIMRAKRIRSRLREERLRRIARYKTRLAALLHPQVEHK